MASAGYAYTWIRLSVTKDRSVIRGGDFMNRRTLLALIAGTTGLERTDDEGAGTAWGGNRAIRPVSSEGPTGDQLNHSSSQDIAGGAAISLQSIGEWMDPQRPPKRVRGNEPPWENRPEVSAGQLCSYEHDGKRRRYAENPEESRANAYDLGMVNRDENGVDNTPLSEKGFLELHRWADAGDSLRTQHTNSEERTRTYSLRSIVDRHVEGIRHKILWQNVRMPKFGSDKESQRAMAFGELFGTDDYDIVAMCELSQSSYLETLADLYENEYSQGGSVHRDWTGSPPSDMGGVVAETDERTVSYSGDTFDSNFGVNKEGWQRFDIELPSDRFGEDVGFEIISTHLDSGNSGMDIGIRENQLRDLAAIIEDRQSARPNWPKLLMGDLNIHSQRENHTFLLEELSAVDMQDAWQTYGGPARRMGKGSCEPRTDPDEQICHCADFHEMGGNRFDYVFLEEPKEVHDVRLDLSRMWRTAWQQSCYTREQMGEYEDAFVVEGNRLTDHHGIGFELLTSPVG